MVQAGLGPLPQFPKKLGMQAYITRLDGSSFILIAGRTVREGQGVLAQDTLAPAPLSSHGQTPSLPVG